MSQKQAAERPATWAAHGRRRDGQGRTSSWLATRDRMVTQTISITSTQSNLRSSGTACENEIACTNGQKRHEERRAGHDVALTSFQT